MDSSSSESNDSVIVGYVADGRQVGDDAVTQHFDQTARVATGGVSKIEELRASLFRASLAQVTLCVLLLGTFWSAYEWIIVCIVLTMICGVISTTHFASTEAMYHSHCCCAPKPAILFLYFASFVLTPLAVASFVASLLSLVGSDGSQFILGLVAAVGCALLTLVDVFYWVRCREVRAQLNNVDNGFGAARNQVIPEVIGWVDDRGNTISPPQDAAPDVEMVHQGSVTIRPVVIGVPIHISPQASHRRETVQLGPSDYPARQFEFFEQRPLYGYDEPTVAFTNESATPRSDAR